MQKRYLKQYLDKWAGNDQDAEARKKGVFAQ